jgi:hypothetical protein
MATREHVRREPTSEVRPFHSMKLGGDWGLGFILVLRGHTAAVVRQLAAGIQVLNNGSDVKEVFSAVLRVFE